MDDLKAKIEAFPDSDLRHRLTRAESWLRRGNAETDADAKYIFLWIAFNAAYAVRGRDRREWEYRLDYFDALVPLDTEQRIHSLLSTALLPPIRDIMNNVYLFHGFWSGLTEPPFNWQDWPRQGEFEEDSKFVTDRLTDWATPTPEELALMLRKLFARLSVLRNQLMHGCATQDGTLNRRQVDAGSVVLGPLVHVFLDIMVDNPQIGWGALEFPVRDDIREDRREWPG